MKINEDLITTDPVSMLSHGGVDVYALRLDKIHPVISGNKWYKLKFHLEEATQQGKSTILTFGGAYSNHIVATAAACAMQGFKCIGIIRGEAPQYYSHTLNTALDYGMKLIFLSRSEYKRKQLPTDLFNETIYVVPEGGCSTKGAKGAATIPYDHTQFDTICCAVGTGTMISGLINGKSANAEVLGLSVLKNNLSVETEIRKLLLLPTNEVQINHEYHFGGYAKHTPELFKFMNDLYNTTGIPTDFVYTGKLFYGLHQLIKKGFFKKNAKILIVHSGGLQGNLSQRKGTLIF